MIATSHGPKIRGIALCCMFALLAACAERNDSNAKPGDDGVISAPLPVSLVAAFKDIQQGTLRVVLVVDRGTVNEASYTLEDVTQPTADTFSGKLTQVITPGFHTFDLEYYIVGTGFAGEEAEGIKVGEALGSGPSNIAKGKNNIVDFSRVPVDTSMDADQDTIPDLIELRLRTNPRSAQEFPQFNVSGVSPTDGASAIPVNAAIIVQFSEALNRDTINSDNFTVIGSNGVAVTGTFSVTDPTPDSAAKVTFALGGASLQFGTEYSVHLNNAIRSLSGAALVAMDFKFTTVNITPPVTLSGVQVGYEEFVPGGAAVQFIIADLVPGSVYAVALNGLQQNLNMSLFSSSAFANEICASRQNGTTSERCVVSADNNGNIYLQVDGSLATDRSRFILDMNEMSSLNGVSGSTTGNVALDDSRLYILSGLQAGAEILLELTELSGDGDLLVYGDDGFSNLLCSSQRRGFYYYEPQASSEGCIAAAANGGNLYIKVSGLNSQKNPDTAVDYTLSWGAPEIVTLDAVTDTWPQSRAAGDRIVTYYHITGLEPQTEYVLEAVTTNGFSLEPRVHVYSGPKYDDATVICQNLSSSGTCVITSTADKDLYVVVDAVFPGSDILYRFNTQVLTDLTGKLPYSFTGDGINHYYKVSGLDPALEHAVVLNNDASAATSSTDSNQRMDYVYSEITLNSTPCKNSSIDRCSTGYVQGDVPNDAGVLYFSAGGGSSQYKDAPLVLMVAPSLGYANVDSYTSSLAGGSREFFIDEPNDKVVRLFAMNKDLNLEVFNSSLATPDCVSSNSIGGDGMPLEDYCGPGHVEGAGTIYFVRITDASGTLDAGNFSMDWAYYNYWNRAFGYKNPSALQAGNRFESRFVAGEVLKFVELMGLDPSTQYTLTLSGISGLEGSVVAGAPIAVRAYGGPVVAGTEDCAAQADATCVVTSDANGFVRLELRATAEIAATTYYRAQLVRDPPPTTKLDFAGGVGPLTLPAQAIGPLRNIYYKVTGLNSAAMYNINLTNISSDVDLYLYQDGTFESFKSQNCGGATASYSTQAGTVSEACSALAPIAETVNSVTDYVLYFRVFGYSRTVSANYDVTVSVAP